MSIINRLFNKKPYIEGEIKLKERYRTNEVTSYDGVPTVYYDILNIENETKVGTIELRLSVKDDAYYYGHIGYNIIRQYRGNHYAYKACKLLFEIAKNEFNMDELIITCSPENLASYKTLKKLDGELIDFVEVPKNHLLYMNGEKTKYIFRYKINL